MIVPQSPQLETPHPIAVTPLRNLSQTPLAGEKAEQTLMTLLLERKVITQSPPNRPGQSLAALLDTDTADKQIRAWLNQNNFDYVLSGAVNEWGYSKGIAGDPSVSITLWIAPAHNPDQMLWRATGSRIGFGYKNIAALAQDVLAELLEGINIAQ
jgi:peptidoglycan hydrolase-like protein with peptidoglycan-binding domain